MKNIKFKIIMNRKSGDNYGKYKSINQNKNEGDLRKNKIKKRNNQNQNKKKIII